MKRKYKAQSENKKEIARERIKILFQQAKEKFPKNPELSNRYVKLARELAMKVKIRIPPELKRKFCKHCYKYLVPSKNLRVRTRNKKIVYYCLECKKYTRIPYKK